MRLLDNYKVKLVALIIAILIWFFVVTENDYEHVIQVPVSVLNIPDDKVILNDLPDFVKVKVKGTGKDLIALGVRRGARVTLDLSDVDYKKTFALEPTDVFLSRPTGAIQAIEVIMPDSITVLLDDFERKKIPVKSQINFKVAPGHTQVGDIRINPDSVVVSGPRSIVSQLNELPTEELEYQDLIADLKETVALAPLSSNKVRVSLNKVQISLNIQKLVEITFTGVQVQVRNAPKSVNVYPRPSRLSLVLEGGGELLAQLDRKDIIAYLDYARIKEAPGIEHPAVIETPPGIKYRDVEPKTFKLVFENKSSN